MIDGFFTNTLKEVAIEKPCQGLSLSVKRKAKIEVQAFEIAIRKLAKKRSSK